MQAHLKEDKTLVKGNTVKGNTVKMRVEDMPFYHRRGAENGKIGRAKGEVRSRIVTHRKNSVRGIYAVC